MSSPNPNDDEEDHSETLLTTWAAGMQVGRYTLMGKIAIGGMAEIWLARQAGPRGFEKVVVIKKILDSYCQDEGFVNMFLDEARTASQLNHPNVVQIYDLGEHDHAYFLAMEYLAGETVGKIVRGAAKTGVALPYTFAARIIADAAAGLGYAHAKRNIQGQPLNIVHRDVSPQNLMVTYDGQVKVLDFGVARAANRATLTEEGKFKGKVPYMSPEQARATAIDKRADIFSLGIILYELIGRCRLFQHEDFVVGLKAVSAEEPVPSVLTRNPEVPPGLAAVTMKALEREAGNRFQTAELLRAALEDWLRSEKVDLGATELSAYMGQMFADRIAKQVKLIEAARAGIVGTPDSDLNRLATPSDHSKSMPGGLTRMGLPKRARWGIGGGVITFILLLAGGFAMRSPDVKPVDPVLGPATIAIDADPRGALISLDGKPVGAAPISLNDLPVGRHAIRAVAEGFEPNEQSVEIHLGERTNVLLTLKPTAAPPQPGDPDPGQTAVIKPPPAVKVGKGKLTLSTTPWAQVFEGTKKLGETPLVEVPLSAGKHKLTLKNDERGLSKSITVEIKANQTTLLRENL